MQLFQNVHDRCPVCGEMKNGPCRSRLTGRKLSVKHDADLYLSSGGKAEQEPVQIKLLNQERDRQKDPANVERRGRT